MRIELNVYNRKVFFNYTVLFLLQPLLQDLKMNYGNDIIKATTFLKCVAVGLLSGDILMFKAVHLYTKVIQFIHTRSTAITFLCY